MFRTFLEKRRIRKTFGKVVDPEMVESLRDDETGRPSLTQAHIEFVLALVGGDSAAEISELVGRVADNAQSHNAVVHDLVGSLIIIAFGTQAASPVRAGSRSALVDELRRELGGHIKIVHGAAKGHYGIIGSEKRTSFSFILPKFDVILGTLCRLEFGQIQEFRE